MPFTCNFCGNILKMYYNVSCLIYFFYLQALILFTDAEIFKYVSQYFIVCDGSRDGAHVIENLS